MDSKITLKIFINLLFRSNRSMALKLDIWHWVLEYFLDCLNSGLGMTLTNCKVKNGKMLGHKISWTVLKIFIQERSNDDFWLTLGFPWQCQICFLVFHMGRFHGFSRRVLCAS